MDEGEFIAGREMDAGQADRMFRRELLKLLATPKELIAEPGYSNYAVAAEKHRRYVSALIEKLSGIKPRS